MEYLRRELDRQDREKEQDVQREAATQEAIRREMVRAQNNLARAAAYRKALHADPRITKLQILDMKHPLDIESVYVRVRVHDDTRIRCAIDPPLATTESHE
jgi:hypothetical protein